MATFVCRVQFLDDTDPFNSTNFPEPTRPPHYTFREDIPLINQIAGVHRLLRAPHKLDDCALQLSHNGTYLDLESSLAEQRDELEEKLYNSNGRDLRRALFSLKQIFQDDKDLVHEFVMAEGLTCLIKVGTEADQNYQNYILRALGQIMLYVDGMNGVINHIETIQWLYALIGSKFRLVVKTALKLLLVFVEYSESNAPLLIEAISTVDTKRGCTRWSNAMEILAEKDGVDTELLVYTTTLINKTLSALPDQDSFYDMVDVLEEQGMEGVAKRFLGRRGTDLDLMEQLNIYETPCVTLLPPPPNPYCPPPPPMFGFPPPPPMSGMRGLPPPPPFSTALPSQPLFQKKKKTIKLFWSEVGGSADSLRSSGDSLWSKLEPVRIDTSKLEHLFETKSKEIPKTAADGKRQEVIVLDSKRSNSINIGLTVLPPPRTIKTAILNFDEYALNKEGIEKILTMVPTEEEKQKIQEAQLANPDIPLGSAEQFLLILSSISELSARLQLWAFKMDYEVTEKEVAEPLQDLKEGMEQLQKNKTLRYILSTLLAIGNFLNSTNAKGFELSYLEKVPEVKDTVHKQSLLHHACSIVVDNYPQSTDLYSEIGAITRSAKVDFDQLQENLALMERRCKASWDHLKVIAKHEMKPTLKQKMSDFLKDCAERIIILKIVHRRIINRFHAFLLYLGHPAYSIREISVHRFSKIISEFALEYRTTRDRVLQQKQKRADHRERNKTRGKMIMDSTGRCNAGSSSSAPSGVVECVQPQGLGHAEDAAEHEFMKAVLKTSLQGGDREVSGVPGLRTRTRSRPGRGGEGDHTHTHLHTHTPTHTHTLLHTHTSTPNHTHTHHTYTPLHPTTHTHTQSCGCIHGGDQF
uniref:Formin homology 2 domain containing 3a n=1 Tax=Esox lucius TaxID=8010 RepID=A0A6Q2Y1X0_ESOLU